MSDLISRQAAIEAVTKYCTEHDLRDLLADLEVLPTAEQAQKTGKWITKSDTNPYYTTWWYECSECGQKPLRDGYGQEVLSDYCPNCGARMEREEE